MGESTALIRIGAAAQQAGMSVKTVRFYSDEELIPLAGRTSGGYRLYHRQVVEELRLIQNLRSLGLPLATIRSYLSAKRVGTCQCEQLKQALWDERLAIDHKIAALKNIQYELSKTMDSWVNCGGRSGAKLM